MDKVILQYEADLAALKKQLDAAKSQLKGVESTAKSAGKETRQAFEAGAKAANRYGIEVVKAGDNTKQALSRGTMSAREMSAAVTNAGTASNKRFGDLNKSITTVSKSTASFGKQIPGLTASIGQLAGAMGIAFGTQQLIAFGKESIKTAENFEKAVSSLSSLTGLVGEDLKFLSESAKDLSVSTLEGGVRVTSSAEDLVKAFELVGSARPELLSSKEALVDLTKEAIILSEASGLTLPDAVKALTDTMNQFGAPANQARIYIDALAAGAKYGSAAIPDISEAIVKFGVSAKAANVSVNESVAVIETLAAAGKKGAEAGTSLRTIFSKLSNASVLPKEAATAFKAAGVDVKILSDSSLSLEDRLREASKLLKVTGGLTKVFGEEHANTALALLQNVDLYAQLNENIQEAGVATDQAATNTDNYASRMKQFNNQITLIKMQLGEALIPALTDVASGISSILKGDFSLDGLDNMGNAFDRITKIIQYIPQPLNGVIRAVKNLRGAFDAFNDGDIVGGFKKIGEAAANFVTFGVFGMVKEFVTGKKKIVEGFVDIEKAAKTAIETMTDKQVEDGLKSLAAQSKMTQEQLSEMASKFRAERMNEIFIDLAKAVEITKDQFKELTDISDKYGISARVNASLILDIANTSIPALNEAYEKFNKTLGVSRKDWDDYIGKVKGFKPKAAEAEEGQDKLTMSAKKAIGPYEALTKAVSGLFTKLQDLSALALRGKSLEVLGSQADKLKEAQFRLALANNLVTVSLGDYTKELEDLSKFMDGEGKFLFTIPGGDKQAARIKELIALYEEQRLKLKELADQDAELREMDKENASLEQDKIDQQKQLADEILQTRQQATDFLISLGVGVTNQYEQQLADLQAFRDRDIISEEEYLKAKEQLYLKQAAAISGSLGQLADSLNSALSQIFGEAAEKNELFLAFQKAISIAAITFKSFEAIANGAAAFSAGITSGDPIKIIGGISAIIGGVGNLIGGLIAQVNAVDIPQAPGFFEGTPYLQLNGNPDGRDTIPIMANKGEAIIPTAENMANPGLADAWINGNLDQFNMTKWMPQYVEDNMPMLMRGGYGDIDVKAELNDKNLSKKLDSNTAATHETNYLLREYLGKKQNPWTC